MNAITTTTDAGTSLMESVIVKGDLSRLTPDERARYYTEVCRSMGLNPLTQPFQYITLNSRLTLYATRTCTDQLRSIRGVSVEDLAATERDGIIIVTAKVRDKDGRTDISRGAVATGNLKGEALANAIMKAETKAKRRATLSICGLGWMDETDVDMVPGARREPMPALDAPPPPPPAPTAHDPDTGEVAPRMIPFEHAVGKATKAQWGSWGKAFMEGVRMSTTHAELDEWTRLNYETHVRMAKEAPEVWERLRLAMQHETERLGPADPVDVI